MRSSSRQRFNSDFDTDPISDEKALNCAVRG